MKAFLASVVVVVVIAVGANFVLNGFQKPAESAYTSPTGARPNCRARIACERAGVAPALFVCARLRASGCSVRSRRPTP
jgi:hypothetical protein